MERKSKRAERRTLKSRARRYDLRVKSALMFSVAVIVVRSCISECDSAEGRSGGGASLSSDLNVRATAAFYRSSQTHSHGMRSSATVPVYPSMGQDEPW